MWVHEFTYFYIYLFFPPAEVIARLSDHSTRQTTGKNRHSGRQCGKMWLSLFYFILLFLLKARISELRGEAWQAAAVGYDASLKQYCLKNPPWLCIYLYVFRILVCMCGQTQ